MPKLFWLKTQTSSSGRESPQHVVNSNSYYFEMLIHLSINYIGEVGLTNDTPISIELLERETHEFLLQYNTNSVFKLKT